MSIGKESLLKVKDHSGLFRDPNTNAILVDNPSARTSYHNQRQLVNEIDTIKRDLNDIKEVLKLLYTKL